MTWPAFAYIRCSPSSPSFSPNALFNGQFYRCPSAVERLARRCHAALVSGNWSAAAALQSVRTKMSAARFPARWRCLVRKLGLFLVFIEETCLCRGVGRSSRLGERAGSHSSRRCCRAPVSLARRASALRGQCVAGMGMPQPMRREPWIDPCLGRRALQHEIDGTLGEASAELAGAENGIVGARITAQRSASTMICDQLNPTSSETRRPPA